jgi:hypothetical protein
LHTMLQEALTSKKLAQHVPTLAQIIGWIAEAKTLAATSPE